MLRLASQLMMERSGGSAAGDGEARDIDASSAWEAATSGGVAPENGSRRESPSLEPSSLAARAFKAIALTVFFYLLAVAIAALLVYIPLAEVTYTGGREPGLLILWVGAAAILWSIAPRRDRFEAPGALLVAQAQPGLFAAIDRVANLADQPRPAEVYLLRDANAWVSSRGGVMGLGSRRIMGIGLPLLQQLTVSQLQAVLAHEFGHYHGGHVKLGPWIYHARAAIGRTIETLAESGVGLLQLIQRPFVWYGEFFLRFTFAISRQQELDADALSFRLVGRDAIVSTLKALPRAAEAFEVYWRGAVVPVLGAGYRPPIVGGFAHFLEVRSVVSDGKVLPIAPPEERLIDPYDTHPPLRDRVAHIEGLHAASKTPTPLLSADDRPAIRLLDDVDRTELELLRAIAPDPASVPKLSAIDWARVGPTVSVERWRRATREAAAALGDMTPATAPTGKWQLEALGSRILGSRAAAVPREALALHAANVIAAATACALAQAGWSVEAMPGAPVVLRRGDTELRPFEVLTQVLGGQAHPISWARLHAAGGVSSQPLAAV
jgi:Zn-dependent protease with chaperone function